MLLCIDCGNTNTVFSIWTGKQFLATWRLATDWQRTADQYHVWLTTLMQFEDIKVDIDEIVVSSTVPRVVFNLRVFANTYHNIKPLVVGKAGCLLPVAPRVDAGTAIGPDRLVNSAGAFDRYGGHLIVVDFGTATTFDVVDGDGAYIGGVISPGVNTSLEALHLSAAALPHVDVSKPQRVIGTSTVACMTSGVFWGYVGLVREITTQIKTERNMPMKVIATGGLAPLFAQGANLFDIVDGDLTIHGLTVIHRFNKDGGGCVSV